MLCAQAPLPCHLTPFSLFAPSATERLSLLTAIIFWFFSLSDYRHCHNRNRNNRSCHRNHSHSHHPRHRQWQSTQQCPPTKMHRSCRAKYRAECCTPPLLWRDDTQTYKSLPQPRKKVKMHRILHPDLPKTRSKPQSTRFQEILRP